MTFINLQWTRKLYYFHKFHFKTSLQYPFLQTHLNQTSTFLIVEKSTCVIQMCVCVGVIAKKNNKSDRTSQTSVVSLVSCFGHKSDLYKLSKAYAELRILKATSHIWQLLVNLFVMQVIQRATHSTCKLLSSGPSKFVDKRSRLEISV